MALSAAEKKELDDLKARLLASEKATEHASIKNSELLKQAEDDAVTIAQAEMDKQEAIDLAVEEKEAEMAAQLRQATTGKIDKSTVVDPNKPPTFNRGAYFSDCSGGGVVYAQSGWYFDHAGKAVRPINAVKKKA